MKEDASELGFIYPTMFRDEISVKGYGLGGTKGPDGLALQMLDKWTCSEVGVGPGRRRMKERLNTRLPRRKGRGS